MKSLFPGWSDALNPLCLLEQNDPKASKDAVTHSLSSQVGLLLRFAQAAVWGDLLGSFKPFGFRPQHYAALKIIESRPGCKQLELGEALGISRSNLVMLIDELVDQKLVERRQNSIDRRSNALSLSGRAKALLPELDQAQFAHETRLARVLTENERDTLVDLLRKLSRLQEQPARPNKED